MKIFTTLLLFFSLICLTSNFHAQVEDEGKGSITGIIADTNKTEEVLEGAVVSLLNASDSSLLKTEITDAEGRYAFLELDPGKYLLVVTHADYETFSTSYEVSSSKIERVIINILLKVKTAEKLDEVTVVAKIPVIERKIDRTVVNVEAMISSAGNNALELLEKSPGVMVNQNGTIMLKGKPGVLIYIDDKPTYLGGDALTNYLKSLPAATISQIEIMTNPPAKYDAAGNVGIINIITKKSKLKGFNASFSVNYGQGRYLKSSNNFNFNYRNNKVNVFGTLNGGRGLYFNDLYINRTYQNEDLSVKSHFNQNTKAFSTNNFGGLKLGVDFYATKKTTLGLTTNGWLTRSIDKSRNISLLSDASNTPTMTVIADNGETSDFKSGSLNFNLRHKFDSTGKMITVDLDYVRYGTLSDQSYLNNTYAPDGSLVLTDRLDGDLPATIDIYAFKTDYTHPLKKEGKFEAGFKASYTSIDNLVNYYTTVGGISTADYDKSNHFKYNEVINAAYLNFSRSYKRFAFQTGLRSEGTISAGNQLGNPVKPTARFNRDYLSVFPTAYLTYNLDSAENNQLAFSYGRRIDRPYYQDLNPFVRPLDKFTFYSGNPLLRPMFSQNMTFTYSYKSIFSTSLSYNRTKNEINETIEIDTNSLYFSRPGNIGQSQVLSLSVNATIPVGKWLSSNIYSEVTNTQYKSKLYTQQLNSKGTYFYIGINNAIQLSKGWSAEVSGYYITRVTSAQFTLLEHGQLTLGAQKKILKDKGSIKLSIRDVFYTELNRGIINNLRLTEADYSNRWDTRAVFVTFSYSFGKPFVTQPKHEGSGSESEQQRVKN